MNKAIKTHKNTIIAVVLVTAALLLSIVTYAYSQPRQNTAPKPQATVQKAEQKTPETISYAGEKGKTALAQLQAAAKVETKASEYGAYVDSINGIKGGQDGKYWTFYVNGKMANIGASEYIAKGGEKIEWKFEKLQ